MQPQTSRTDDPLFDDERVEDDRAPVGRDLQTESDTDVFGPGGGLTWAESSNAERPTAEPAPGQPTTTKRSFTWGQVLILLAGAVSLVFGVGAVALAGLAGSVTEPVVEVFTFDHTPLLGLIEIGAGVVLILCGLVRGGRWVAGPIGVGAIVGGALVLAEVEWAQTELAAERRFGWVPIMVGAAAYLGAMVPARKRGIVDR